ncbi:hypothetical protein DICSQDRAFT_171254 [Dichomitus squalens LYAD-421 SS1]|uniref:Uncharacterized protein n=2 Tax=Dichomitus squalens TaxID=114155 RepID=A0A4Q9MQ74_9APHY|nr:uncharacterized protein DICSQDRAFT_171254 [Dichomitus squalens LYAD-421 SS1]EJF60292.1 hypothetical protein DICSQDRAFT_171254 [Dichomitus squalens LYAD-421 SS1]TBU28381.1 hypothetical protein BD311DRAFT_722562 [Dichomitus squalens]
MPTIPPISLSPLTELSARARHIIPDPLSKTKFTLDSSGVAGFFGGDSAVSGMATVNLIPSRRWGGWYNTPGSYEIAKQYGQLAGSKYWNGLFPGGNDDPAKLFELDGKLGPKFIAAHSGSHFPQTGHLAYLVFSYASKLQPLYKSKVGRATTDSSVTIIDLHHVPPVSVRPTLPSRRSVYFALIPIITSVGTCVLCALVGDWFCFGSIALGIIANGLACLIIGSGQLTFTHHTPAEDAPPGDGVLSGVGGLVVLLGEEGAVNCITRGRYHLRYGGGCGAPSSMTTNGSAVESMSVAAGFRAGVQPPEHTAPPAAGEIQSLARGKAQTRRDSIPVMSTAWAPTVGGERTSSATMLRLSPYGGLVPDTDHLDAPASVAESATSMLRDEAETRPALPTSTPFSLPMTGSQTTIDCPPQPSTSTAVPPPAPTEPPLCDQFLLPSQGLVGPCSFLLMIQFLVQLLLIPQGTLFGQVMFVGTVVFSWGYNSYLSSIDREGIQTDVLFQIMKLSAGDEQSEHISKIQLRCWTATVVCACLALQRTPEKPINDLRKLLDELLPDSKVWRLWKDVIAWKLTTSRTIHLEDADWNRSPRFAKRKQRLDSSEKKLLSTILADAKEANDEWETFEREREQRRYTGAPGRRSFPEPYGTLKCRSVDGRLRIAGGPYGGDTTSIAERQSFKDKFSPPYQTYPSA